VLKDHAIMVNIYACANLKNLCLLIVLSAVELNLVFFVATKSSNRPKLTENVAKTLLNIPPFCM